MTKMETDISKVENTVNQLASSVKAIEDAISQIAKQHPHREQGALPSDVKNPRDQCKAITLRSGREVVEKPKTDTTVVINAEEEGKEGRATTRRGEGVDVAKNINKTSEETEKENKEKQERKRKGKEKMSEEQQKESEQLRA